MIGKIRCPICGIPRTGLLFMHRDLERFIWRPWCRLGQKDLMRSKCVTCYDAGRILLRKPPRIEQARFYAITNGGAE